MGDFNQDALGPNPIHNIAASLGLRQLIHEPTTDYGSALDHIYTNLPQELVPLSGALESYYSDHKPVFANVIPPCPLSPL